MRVPAAALAGAERALARLPAVRFVDRNLIHPPVFVPNNPSFPSEWHLPRIAAPQAWDMSQGAPGVVIAILDSGIDPAHPDLSGKLVPGFEAYHDNTDTRDVFGHGTKVAGAAAATGDNGIGVAGVALLNRPMPIRVTDASGYACTSTISQGLVWAAEHGSRVMNMSFGGVAGSSTIMGTAQYVRNTGFPHLQHQHPAAPSRDTYPGGASLRRGGEQGGVRAGRLHPVCVGAASRPRWETVRTISRNW